MARQLRTIPESQTFYDVTQFDDWQILATMGRTANGEWVIRSLTIEPVTATLDEWARRHTPDGGVTAKLLRSISLADIRRYGRRVIKADDWSPPEPKARRDALAGPGRVALY